IFRITKSWDEMYSSLLKYVALNKKFPIICKSGDNEKSIAIWICRQRTAYKKNTLSQDQIKKLESIQNWDWGKETLTEVKTWDESYELLLKYIESNNKLPPVNSRSNDNDAKIISSWACRQRWSFKKNKLTPEQIK